MLLQVSYHDVPDRAYETFVSVLTSKYLEQGLVIPSLVDVHNPAGNLWLTYPVASACNSRKLKNY